VSRQPGDVAVVPPVVAESEYGIQRLEPGSRKRAGKPIDDFDIAVAAIALAHGARVITAKAA